MNFYDFTIEVAREAGERLLKAQDTAFTVSHKGDDYRNMLTSVDIETDEFIKDAIRRTFPEHKIFSEEDTQPNTTHGEYEWMIDPLDGTSNFARGLPHFGTCIALLHSGVPVVGAVYCPTTRELFSFEEGKGTYLNGKAIAVSSITALRDVYAILHIGRKEALWEWGFFLQRELLKSAKKTINLASSGLDICFLAAGRFDAVIYGTLSTRDVASAIGILRAAGGEIYTLQGQPVTFSADAQSIIATNNKTVFEEIQKISNQGLQR